MKNHKLLDGIEKHAAALIDEYVDGGGGCAARIIKEYFPQWERGHLAKNLGSMETWDTEAELCVILLLTFAERSGDYQFVCDHFKNHEAKLLNIAAKMETRPKPLDLASAILGHYLADTSLADEPTAERPFRSVFTNYAWEHLDWSVPVRIRNGWLRALARWRPKKLAENLTRFPDALAAITQTSCGTEIIEETDQIDDLLVEWAKKELTAPQPAPTGWSSAPSGRCVAFANVKILSALRNGRYHELVLGLSIRPEFSWNEHAVEVLLRDRPDVVLKTVEAGFNNRTPWAFTDAHRELVALALREITGDGLALLRKILVVGEFRYGWSRETMEILFQDPSHEHAAMIRGIFLDHVAGLSGRKVSDFWGEVANHDKGLFLPEWQKFAEGKSKLLRDIAAAWLLANRAEDAKTKADNLLASGVTGDRLAGISLLASSVGQAELARLKSLHGSEPIKLVRVAIAAVLAKHGVTVEPEPKKEVEGIDDFAEFEKRLAAKPKSIKLPKAPWLVPEKLPPLFTREGSELSELARTFLFQRQAREKGEVNEEVVPILPNLDRSRNAPFAHALIDQWFASDMKAPTRWALDVAGITGDDSIIDRLTQPIPHWCQANSGSIAIWAAHAIALLGTETSLCALDGLIHKYRNHRKYVSEAASVAIHTAAEMLGITDDELAERIVPDFEFDADGNRDFAMKKGTVTAFLTPEFKILWRVPDSNEFAASPSVKLTPDVEDDLKETRKFLKEAVTRQTSRLQNAMIASRRWPIDPWRARFENHPVFRNFAMRLIWGVYDQTGSLLRTFRLYPNGLTASADGSLEEFYEPAATIGVVHGLELDEDTRKSWAAHLRRFKVKPLFPQLDRTVNLLDPLHGNRKELRLTEGIHITAGKLRTDLLGNGWSVGSTGDGGWVFCMFRKFPACDIDVYLPVSEFHATSSKNDKVELGSSFFARGATGKKSYRDHMDEAQAVTFDQVPPIVYSEILGNLTSLIAE